MGEWRRNLAHTLFSTWMGLLLDICDKHGGADRIDSFINTMSLSPHSPLCSLSYCYSPALNTGLWLVRTCHVTRILGPDWSRLSPDLTRALSWPQAGDWAGADPASDNTQSLSVLLLGWSHTDREYTPPRSVSQCVSWSVATSDKWAEIVRIGKDYGWLMVLSTVLSGHCVIMPPAQDVSPPWTIARWLVSAGSAPGWRHWLLISVVTNYNKTKSQNHLTTRSAVDSLVMALQSSDQ